MVQRVDADAYCVQELLRPEAARETMIKAMAACDLHSVLNPSVLAEGGGWHCGAAVYSRWACGIQRADSDVVKMPAPERFAVASWDAVFDSGVLLASVYLFPSQGLSRSNALLLDQIAAYLLASGRPFILSGDWQNDPEVIERSGWPAAIGAKVLAPTSSTYRAAGAETKIDFFIVDRRLCPEEGDATVEVVEHEPWGLEPVIPKHLPVLLRIKGVDRGRTILTAAAPRRLRVLPRYTCRQLAECDLPWDVIKSKAEAVTTPTELDDAYRCFNGACEKEILDSLGESLSDDMLGKRGVQPELRTKHPLQDVGRHTLAGQTGRLWRLLETKLVRLRRSCLDEAWSNAKATLLELLKHAPLGRRPPEWKQWRLKSRELYKAFCAAPTGPTLLEHFGTALEALLEVVVSCAVACEVKCERGRAFNWVQWCRQKAGEPGAPAIHRYARGGFVWPVFLATNELPQKPAEPQVDADLRADDWHTHWKVDAENDVIEWPLFSESDFKEFEMLTVEQFRSLCASFSPSRLGVGCCGFHPRQFRLLSDAAIAAIIALWGAMLRVGAVPKAIRLLNILLIAKAVGGVRPIALIASVVRILNRWLRRTAGETWRKATLRDYSHGSKERSTVALAWKTAALAEYSRWSGLASAVALLDLVKAFENVRHGWLHVCALRFGFPLVLLRFLIEMFRSPRRIFIGRVATAQVSATISILPGDAFSDLLMFLALMWTMDLTRLRWPHAILGVVADDIQVMMLGNAEMVVKDFPEMVAFIVDDLDAAGLQVADGKKFVLQAAGKPLRDRLVPRINACFRKTLRPTSRFRVTSSHFKRTARNLGIDVSFSAGRRVTTLAERLRKSYGKACKLKAVRKAGVGKTKMHQIAKAALASGPLYGSSINGFSDSQIGRLRSMVRSSLVKAPGSRSAFVDLQLVGRHQVKNDDAVAAAVSPPFMWMIAWREKWLPHSVMKMSFDSAAALGDRLTWRAVAGPAAATLLSLKRAGWTTRASDVWATPRGEEVHLDSVSPLDARKVLEEDYLDEEWKRLAGRRSAFSELAATPLLEPILQLLFSKKSPLSSLQRAMLAAVAADAHKGCPAVCPLCGDPNSVWHMVWSCPALAIYRHESDCPLDLRRCAEEGEGESLFSTLLVPNPAVGRFAPARADLEIRWMVASGEQPLFEGQAFGDGSAILPGDRVTRRCGWAVASALALYQVAPVHVEANVGARVVAYGHMPGILQIAPLAEAFALSIALLHAMPDSRGCFTFFTDCMWVITTFQAGEHVAADAGNVGSALWSVIFKRAAELLGDSSRLVLRKVKGHRSVASCSGDPELLFQRGANNIVDKFAKDGSRLHVIDSEALKTKPLPA